MFALVNILTKNLIRLEIRNYPSKQGNCFYVGLLYETDDFHKTTLFLWVWTPHRAAWTYKRMQYTAKNEFKMHTQSISHPILVVPVTNKWLVFRQLLANYSAKKINAPLKNVYINNIRRQAQLCWYSKSFAKSVRNKIQSFVRQSPV